MAVGSINGSGVQDLALLALRQSATQEKAVVELVKQSTEQAQQSQSSGSPTRGNVVDVKA